MLFHPQVADRGLIDDHGPVCAVFDDCDVQCRLDGLEAGQTDLRDVADPLSAAGGSGSHEFKWGSSSPGERRAVQCVCYDKPVVMADVETCEARIEYTVACDHGNGIACGGSKIIEPAGSVRDAVIDPSHEPPERDAVIDLSAGIGVCNVMAGDGILQFRLREQVADNAVEEQAVVPGRKGRGEEG